MCYLENHLFVYMKRINAEIFCRYRQAEEHHDYIMDMVRLNKCSNCNRVRVRVIILGQIHLTRNMIALKD